MRLTTLGVSCLLAGMFGCDDGDEAETGEPLADAGSVADGAAPDADVGDPDAALDPDAAPDMSFVGLPGCQGFEVADLNRDGERDGDGWRIDVSTGDVDEFTPSCSDQEGGDTVVRFTAPSAGQWLFSTLESEVTFINTVLYVLEDCNDGFTELSCNDNANQGLDGRSELALNLEARQTVFLVVDRYAGLEPLDATLTARPSTRTASSSAVGGIGRGPC